MYKNLIFLTAALTAVPCTMFPIVNHGFAELTTYTDSTAFVNDLAVLGYNVEILDFESVAAGTVFPDPSLIGQFTFTSFATAELIVTDDFTTISGQNYLGVNDLGNSNQFVGGFEVDLNFLPSHAIGFFIVTGEIPGFTLFDGDVRLEVPTIGSVELDVDDLQGTVGGDNVFFVGLIDDMQPFSSSLIRYDILATNAMTFNIDDMFTAKSFLLGDVNQDGVVNLLDVAPFVDVLSNGLYQLEADCNQDGVVNLLDVNPFIEILSGG